MVKLINIIDINEQDIKQAIQYLNSVKKGLNTKDLEYKIFTKEEMLENVDICANEIVKYFKENKI